MYLNRAHYVGLNWKEPDTVSGILTVNNKRVDTNIKWNRVNIIRESFGYWRKANAIHNWFVQECQGGVDDCKEYYVRKEQLKELLEKCKEAMTYEDKTGDDVSEQLDNILPTLQGFFFGDVAYDEYYFGYIQETIDLIESIPDSDWEDSNVSFYYESSW